MCYESISCVLVGNRSATNGFPHENASGLILKERIVKPTRMIVAFLGRLSNAGSADRHDGRRKTGMLSNGQSLTRGQSGGKESGSATKAQADSLHATGVSVR